MKNHLEPITKRAVTDYSKAPANQEVTLDAAGKKRANFTNVGGCGCTGKCNC
jgi:hypothetical protein